MDAMACASPVWPRGHDHQVQWSISLIKGSPAKYLGQVSVTSEAEAIKKAVKEFDVAENLRDRIVARKEDY
jgi:hypothetical protein